VRDDLADGSDWQRSMDTFQVERERLRVQRDDLLCEARQLLTRLEHAADDIDAYMRAGNRRTGRPGSRHTSSRGAQR
jgi:hypothetical protein